MVSLRQRSASAMQHKQANASRCAISRADAVAKLGTMSGGAKSARHELISLSRGRAPRNAVDWTNFKYFASAVPSTSTASRTSTSRRSANLQRSAVQRHAVQCRAAQCSAAQCSAAQRSAVPRSAAQCSAAQCSAVPRSAAQCSAVQCSAAQRSTLGAPFNHTTKRGDEHVLERIEPARPSRAIVRCR
jgi:hypothetical protein